MIQQIIRLSEKDLYTIIESILKEFYYGDRKTYAIRVKGLLPVIAVHWCSLFYTVNYSSSTTNIKHWTDELIGFIYSLKETSFKGGDFSHKITVANQAWVKLGFDSSSKVSNAIASKLKKEGMKNTTAINDTIGEFIRSKDAILRCLAASNDAEFEQAKQYIMQLAKHI